MILSLFASTLAPAEIHKDKPMDLQTCVPVNARRPAIAEIIM
jgi:hypothetical protein